MAFKEYTRTKRTHNKSRASHIDDTTETHFKKTPAPQIYEPIQKKHQFLEDAEVLMHDWFNVVKGKVYALTGMQTYSVIDEQGFIHLAEEVNPNEHGGAVLRTITHPRNKQRAGYQPFLA